MERNYWLTIFIALLSFIFGFSLGYFMVEGGVISQNNQSLTQNSTSTSTSTSTSEKEEKDKRTDEFLFGQVEEKKEEEERNTLTVNLNLEDSFSNPFQEKITRNFYIEERVPTKLYQAKEKRLKDQEAREEISFEEIKKGDIVAIKCTLPPETAKELSEYENFTAEIVVKPPPVKE